MYKQQVLAGERAQARGADNRQRLVDAGHEVLSEKGFEATTVKEIARAASVSPGLFHYYFSSKDELLLAVMGEAGERFKERLLHMASSSGAVEARIEGAVRFIEEVAKREPELFRLRYELYALGLRKPEFLPAVGEQLAYIKANMARNLQQWFPEADEVRVGALAAVILACFDGFALQRIAQPEADLAPAYDFLRGLMEAELGPDRQDQE